MGDSTPTLEGFRREIDALDDQLIALLKDRIKIIARVGEFKRSNGEKGLFLRSGREGDMIERIYRSFADNDFHPAAAAVIWRQMIGASTHLESPLSLSVVHHEKCHHLYWLAREHFGTFLPANLQSNHGQVISDVSDGRSAIGIMPYPDGDANWWTLLGQEGESPKIFAHLPAVLSATMPKSFVFGMAIGQMTPEPSGQDQSYFRLTLGETISVSRIQSELQKTKLNASFINTHAHPPLRSLLMKVEGFYTHDSEPIEQLRNALEEVQIIWLGAHPTPISQ